jgi:exosortase
MPALTSIVSSAESKPAARLVRFDLIAGGLLFTALWFLLWRHLSSEWRVNEQYNYGWFVPLLALVLFWLRWEDRPKPEADGHSFVGISVAIGLAIIGLFLILPIRVFEIGNPDWRPLGWLHAIIVDAITLVFIWYCGGRPWLRHFSFPILFTLVAVPWITPIEVPIIQGLMRLVARVAAETVGLLGIAAQVEGNLIRIQGGLIGVNEACSGVRSVQTSLMIGLLFGELKRFSFPRRLGLIAGAFTIALIGNFGRAVFLVWIGNNEGIPAIDRWHDFVGYVILGLIFVGTLFLASLLAKSKVKSRKAKVENGTKPQPDESRSFFLLPNFYFLVLALLWVVAVEVAALLWYRAHEVNLASTIRWEVRWPESAPGFHDVKIQEGIRSTLRFDTGREVIWREEDSGDAATYLLYFFRWRPGTSTILRARAHRPDICLPSAGWRQIADDGIRSYPATKDLELPFRHFVFARNGSPLEKPIFAHAFFCLHEDTIRNGVSQLNVNRPGKWSPFDRWCVVRDGIRNPGQQMLEVVAVSARERSSAAAEERFAQLVPQLIKLESSKSVN